jgi:hypothetical protein
MKTIFLILPFLTVTFLTGCHSGSTNIYHSRNSEAGRAIAGMDEAQRQADERFTARRRAFQKAMMDYEATHGGRRGIIKISDIQRIEEVGPNVHIYRIQGVFSSNEHVAYKMKVTDDDDSVVKSAEILEKLTP